MDIKDLREVLDYATKILSVVTNETRARFQKLPEGTDRLVVKNLCMTTGECNSEADRLKKQIEKTFALKDEILKGINDDADTFREFVYSHPKNEDEYEALLLLLREKEYENADAKSLRELVLSGLKGISWYVYQASLVGYTDEGIEPFIQRSLAHTLNFEWSIGILFNLAMEVGGFGYRVIGLLDSAYEGYYGEPEITNIELGVRKNPGILVAGENLRTVEAVLIQTAGTGVDVYTFGEAISAHTYPELKKYDNFAGNYGGLYDDQHRNFESFNGPVIYSGTGLQEPLDSYKDRLFTVGPLGYPGVKHVYEPDPKEGVADFSEAVEMAKKSEPPMSLRMGEVVAGFGHSQLDHFADTVVRSVKDGSITRLVVMAGTDGSGEERGYYKEYAEKMPGSALILTAGTLQYRFSDCNLGVLRGMPRILPCGQLGDVYSILMFALRVQTDLGKMDLSKAPVTFNLSLNGEKSLLTLLTFVYIGAKEITIGPDFPDIFTEAVSGIFKKKSGVKVIGDPEEDVKCLSEGITLPGGPITTDMLIMDIIEMYPESVSLLLECGMACVSCGSAVFETLEQASLVHGLIPDDVCDFLNIELGLVKDEDDDDEEEKEDK